MSEGYIYVMTPIRVYTTWSRLAMPQMWRLAENS